MKNTFELKSYMTANRESVINKYNEISTSEFFSGIDLRSFMVAVYNNMQANNPRSEKKAAELLISMTNHVANQNTTVQVRRDRDQEARAKYQGTAYMAII